MERAFTVVGLVSASRSFQPGTATWDLQCTLSSLLQLFCYWLVAIAVEVYGQRNATALRQEASLVRRNFSPASVKGQQSLNPATLHFSLIGSKNNLVKVLIIHGFVINILACLIAYSCKTNKPAMRAFLIEA